jgi:hypothetical protein
VISRNKLIFTVRSFSPKLEHHPLSTDHDCLFNVFGVTHHIWRPSLYTQPEDVPCRGDKGPTYRFHKMLENSWVAERLVASHEGFRSMEVVTKFGLGRYKSFLLVKCGNFMRRSRLM